jgi:TolB-like protein
LALFKRRRMRHALDLATEPRVSPRPAAREGAMDTETDRPVRFGSFELDVRSRELRKGSTRVRLQDQPFEILCFMLERPGHVVTRDELRQRLWPEGTFVDFEHSLNAAVKRLRAALGDDADNPRYVETLPRRGYRFIGAMGQADVHDATSIEAPAHRVRLAVLPFTCLGDEGQEYFTDGLTEEMIAQLGRLCRGRVGVIARQSSMAFKGTTRSAREIGAALRADYLLEGSVRRAGERVRIAARLIETAGETHLWVETYERHLTDCLSVQADVAARIAQSLTMELAPDQPAQREVRSPDAAAYNAYLKARFYWNKTADDGIDESVAYFQEAIAA